MKIFKNPEITKTILLSAAVTLCLSAAGFFVAGVYAMCLILLTGIIIAAVFAVADEMRYRRIEKMSIGIDRILHGEDSSIIAEFKEGELAVLQNEVHKMTVRLREAADTLAKDKVFLTDSIADISHQLRTPLTSVNLMLSMLSDKSLDYNRRLELVYSLKRLISRVDWLIETLLKLSKIDAGTARFEKSDIYVKDILSRAAEPLSAALDVRGVTLVSDISDESFSGDLSWSAEAISNILKNCMEHSPDGGRIFVKARQTAIFTEIVIEDEGKGFDKNELPRIFERFYKGKNDGTEGFGIGLALARVIANEQNGTVKAENRETGGARFILRFYFGAV